MGIRGLGDFMLNNFKGWKMTNFGQWDYVIIDGNNVYLNLCKKVNNSMPGEYAAFGTSIEKFSRNLVSIIQSLCLIMDTEST